MTVEVTTLKNGLRVASERMAELETVAIGIFVNAGARNEEKNEHGLSHLLEHMAFKGTASRSARQIAEEIERVGGDINAATSLESTAYFARVLKGDERVAIDIFADILAHAAFDPDELQREQEVIRQEIRGVADSPEEIAFDLMQEAAYPGQPIGRPIIGTEESVSSLSRAELQDFLSRHYVGPRMVVAAAGAIDHEALTRHVEAAFQGLYSGEACKLAPARYQGGHRHELRPFEQTHLVAGFNGPAHWAEGYFAALVLSGLLGGGMSSRLFQEVREVRGLAYAISSNYAGASDTGLLSIHAATAPQRVTELAHVIAGEIGKLVVEPPAGAEVQRAKAMLKASLLMSLEGPAARAEHIAGQLLTRGRIISMGELVAAVDGVTPEDVQAVAKSMFAGAKPSLALVGAGKRSQGMAKRVNELLSAGGGSGWRS